ncbi:MAG: hypothetical protein D3906_15985, partial [Candidatus Electrothrix sp. AUS1_2]|nr:hypothetical protein [Candidatus Electrothrix sp. AUS1_2]
MLRDFVLKGIMLCIAAGIWLPCLHFLYRPDISQYRSDQGVPPKAAMIAARHLDIWTNPQLRAAELAKMQERNPEWDFMSRTYFVLALANMAIRDTGYKEQALDIMDTILENTMRIEQEQGMFSFLLGYGHNDAWVMRPPRSQFIDGEIALMLAARRLVEEKTAYV